MRLVLCGVIIAAGYLIGSAAAVERRTTLDRLSGVMGLISHLIRRVESSNVRLLCAIEEYDSKPLRDCGFYAVFESCGRSCVSRAWVKAVELLCLPDEACKALISLGEGLGRLGRERQLAALRQASAELCEIYDALDGEYGKKARYYGALGALAGALAVIVLL